MNQENQPDDTGTSTTECPADSTGTQGATPTEHATDSSATSTPTRQRADIGTGETAQSDGGSAVSDAQGTGGAEGGTLPSTQFYKKSRVSVRQVRVQLEE
jgi:hypothetical protein